MHNLDGKLLLYRNLIFFACQLNNANNIQSGIQ